MSSRARLAVRTARPPLSRRNRRPLLSKIQIFSPKLRRSIRPSRRGSGRGPRLSRAIVLVIIRRKIKRKVSRNVPFFDMHLLYINLICTLDQNTGTKQYRVDSFLYFKSSSEEFIGNNYDLTCNTLGSLNKKYL